MCDWGTLIVSFISGISSIPNFRRIILETVPIIWPKSRRKWLSEYNNWSCSIQTPASVERLFFRVGNGSPNIPRIFFFPTGYSWVPGSPRVNNPFGNYRNTMETGKLPTLTWTGAINFCLAVLNGNASPGSFDSYYKRPQLIITMAYNP